jgi:hypothetical protein
LIVEPMAGDSLQQNLNPVGRLFYAGSTMVCIPTSLSQEVGAALGAQAGEAKLREVSAKAASRVSAARPRRPSIWSSRRVRSHTSTGYSSATRGFSARCDERGRRRRPRAICRRLCRATAVRSDCADWVLRRRFVEVVPSLENQEGNVLWRAERAVEALDLSGKPFGRAQHVAVAARHFAGERGNELTTQRSRRPCPGDGENARLFGCLW